jgi:hypothetical protein
MEEREGDEKNNKHDRSIIIQYNANSPTNKN